MRRVSVRGRHLPSSGIDRLRSRRSGAIPIALLLLAAAATATAALAAQQKAVTRGAWVGTYTLGGPGQIAFDIGGGRASVALGFGHADLQTVPASSAGGRVRFRLPGRPGPMEFDAKVVGGKLVGTVAQGKARGAFTAKPGAGAALRARGFYGPGKETLAVVDDPYGPARLVDIVNGGVRALYPAGSAFAIGSGFATRTPTTGMAQFGPTSARIEGRPLTRWRHRQFEVRFRSGDAMLSGTLTLPTGPGRHAAVAYVLGSGPTQRAYLPDIDVMLVDRGVAVLAFDKRGIGQSGGYYPGESPTAPTIDILARDAAAAVRFLAAQPEIDPARLGLAGHSQAGWIMPLAATREPAVRFILAMSGPSVTADEVDLFQHSTGQGERHTGKTLEDVEREVLAAGPSGVDPMPWIRKLKIPSLWVYGGLDQHVPARLCVRLLQPLADQPVRDLSILVYPNANHALVETTTGLTSEMLRSDTFAPGLFAAIGDWLKAHRLGG